MALQRVLGDDSEEQRLPAVDGPKTGRHPQISGETIMVNNNNGQWSKMRLSEGRAKYAWAMPSVSILGEANGQWLMVNEII